MVQVDKSIEKKRFGKISHGTLKNDSTIGFNFLVQAYPGSPRQNPESHKTIVVVVVVVVVVICTTNCTTVQLPENTAKSCKDLQMKKSAAKP